MSDIFFETIESLKSSAKGRYFLWTAAGVLMLSLLYLANLYGYLLFHSLAEFFSIMVAFMVFVVSWNSRKYADNGFFLFIGIAYSCVAGLDFVHAITFRGMNIVQGIDTNVPTQLWIAARYIQGISLVIAPIFLKKKIYAPKYLIIFGVFFILLLTMIFTGNFPDAYIEGVGLTPFKIISEYIISLILMIAGVIYIKKRQYFDSRVLVMLTWSMMFTVFAEVSFVFYLDPAGFFNLLGHYFKVISFFLIYQAMVALGISEPQKIIFKKLDESEEKYRILVEASPDSIMFLDNRKRPFFVNSAGRKQFKLQNDTDLEKWDYLSCVDEQDRLDYEIALNNALKGGMSTIEIGRIDKNSVRKIYREIIVPVKSGKVQGEKIFTISRDITKEKEIDSAKTEFISLASHQLKTPLTSAGFAIEILSKKYADDEEASDLLGDLREDVTFMKEIINRLLSVSRIEMGTFVEDPERVRLLPFLKNITNGFSLTLNKRQQIIRYEFSGDLPEHIVVDANILKNVIQNLINNASRYAPANSTIILSVERRNQDILIGIADTGPGIPEDIQAKVFTKMHKAFKALQREGESSGLGLYIAKLFIERIGGKIWFETKKGIGTTFYVSISIR